MVIKFRAERQIDVDRFLRIIPKVSLVSYSVILLPEIKCEFVIKNWTKNDLVDLISRVPDSQLILQTLEYE